MKAATEPARLARVALLVESSRTYGRGILRGIARYAHAHGPWSFFVTERDLHAGIPELLNSWQGDGIIARIEDRRMAQRLLKFGCPVVDVLGQVSVAGIPSFDTDAVAVARLAVDFFGQAGFQHYAFVGYPGIPFSDRRYEAFQRLLADRSRKVATFPEGSEVAGPRPIQEIEREGIAAEQVLARWLLRQPRPLGLLACNDVCAQQVLNACREHGLRVPEEIAVAGVDNDDVLCSVCDPPLTSIEPDTEKLGYEAAATLHRLMSGDPAGSLRTLVNPVRLVERASTDTVASDDPIVVSALRYIRDHVSEGIAVKDVAARLGRSRSDLEKRFRQVLQTSVRSEILRLRLSRVCNLLQETELNLDQVAGKAGFATAAHLCRVFQAKFQQTPTAYRRYHSKNRQ
jgi:LacI family transcriptional regulator